jgi:hypothetical protein
MNETICVTITRQEKFRFPVDFGESIPNTISDEPPPLGDNEGPRRSGFSGRRYPTASARASSSPSTSSRPIPVR